MWWVILGCGVEGDREQGRQECDPVPITDDCLVWECYEVLHQDAVRYWVEWDAGGQRSCEGYDCEPAIARAAYEHCDEILPGFEPPEECRTDCCEVCETGQPCDGGCISEVATCETDPGCACTFDEAC